MRALDLFSGIGGFALGFEAAGIHTAAFCEIDPFCRSLLQKRFPGTPLYGDIKEFKYETEKKKIGDIDIVCGGFPCQPFSVSGKQRGTADDRDLWPQMFRVISEVGPSWVVCENVANFVGMEFRRTKIDLESAGYTVRPFIIPAFAVGAIHRRERVWIVAYKKTAEPSYDNGERRKRIREKTFSWEPGIPRFKNIGSVEDLRRRSALPEPLIRRKNDGVSSSLDRLKPLGNAIIPDIAYIIGKAIKQSHNP